MKKLSPTLFVLLVLLMMGTVNATPVDFHITSAKSSSYASVSVDGRYSENRVETSSLSSYANLSIVDENAGIDLLGQSWISNPHIISSNNNDDISRFDINNGQHGWYSRVLGIGEPTGPSLLSWSLYSDFSYDIVFETDSPSFLDVSASYGPESIIRDTLVYTLRDSFSSVLFSGKLLELFPSYHFNLDNPGQYIITVEGSAMISYTENFLGGLNNSCGGSTYVLSQTLTTVPEPTTMMLFSFGLLGIAGISRKKIE